MNNKDNINNYNFDAEFDSWAEFKLDDLTEIINNQSEPSHLNDLLLNTELSNDDKKSIAQEQQRKNITENITEDITGNQLYFLEKNLKIIQALQEKQTQSFEAFKIEQKALQEILQKQQERQLLKEQKEQTIIHDAYQKPLKSFIIELRNIYQQSKAIYYKPFIIHTIFFVVMAALLSFFLSIYIGDLKQQRKLNQEELILIQQSKKGEFRQCGENSQLCIKIDKQKFYGKDGDYAIVALPKK